MIAVDCMGIACAWFEPGLTLLRSHRERVNEILELPGVKAVAARAKAEREGGDKEHSTNGASAASNASRSAEPASSSVAE